MSTIDSSSSTSPFAALNSGKSSLKATDTAKEASDRFLKLLVTQL